MLGHVRSCAVHEEVVHARVLGFPVDGMAEVIRVEDRVFGHGAKITTVAAVEGPTAQDGAGVAVPLLHLADAVLGLAPVEPATGLDGALAGLGVAHVHDRAGQEGREVRLDADGARARSATAVGLAEGLVEVVVHRVKAHETGRGSADDGVEVRSVVVHLAADAVHEFRGGGDVGLKQAERVRVGDHHRGDGVVKDGLKRLEVDAAVLGGGHLNDFEAGHRGARRVRPVGGVRHHDAGALCFAALAEVLLNAAHGGEFALCTSHGLEGDFVHAGTHREHVLHFVEDGQQALEVVLRLVRMHVADARHLRDDLVDARVVLHRTRAKRIEARVDAEVAA